MPSFQVAPEERPITVSGEQPPRQLARRKSTPETPPPPSRPAPANVLVNEATQIPRPKPEPSPFAAGRRGPKPASMLGTGLSERELKQLREDLAPLAPPAPGLNGDHETRAEESAKIPPSRPANNGRGKHDCVGKEIVFERIQSGPLPPAVVYGSRETPRTRIVQLAGSLGPPPDRIEIPTDQLERRQKSAIISMLAKRHGTGAFETFTTADLTKWVIVRAAAKPESEASR